MPAVTTWETTIFWNTRAHTHTDIGDERHSIKQKQHLCSNQPYCQCSLSKRGCTGSGVELRWRWPPVVSSPSSKSHNKTSPGCCGDKRQVITCSWCTHHLSMHASAHSLEARSEKREKLDVFCALGLSHLFQIWPVETHTHKRRWDGKGEVKVGE